MTQDETRKEIIWHAVSGLGFPYMWGGNTFEDPGMDCSGFVLHCWRESGLDMPDMTAAQLQKLLSLDTLSLEKLEPGDPLFYGRNGIATHVVMALGYDGDYVIGANGGTSFKSVGIPIDRWQDATPREIETYLEHMAQRDACIKIEEKGAYYRRGLLSVGKIPY